MCLQDVSCSCLVPGPTMAMALRLLQRHHGKVWMVGIGDPLDREVCTHCRLEYNYIYAKQADNRIHTEALDYFPLDPCPSSFLDDVLFSSAHYNVSASELCESEDCFL